MLKVQEQTFENEIYNHTYFLSDDKMHCLGYIKSGTEETIMFKNPLKFNSKNRKLVKVK